MDWFYAEAGERKGPIPEEELLRLAQSGIVGSETLVWRSGMPEWKPFREAGPEAPPPVPQFAPSAPQPVWSHTPAIQQYAGFWIRFWALCIDVTILGAVQGILFGILFGGTILNIIGEAMRGDPDPGSLVSQALPMVILGRFGSFLLTGAYYTYCWVTYGATPGKRALGLKVIDQAGGSLTWGQAIGRYLGTLLSATILGIGFLMAAFDDQKRTLHDRLAGTRVIKVD